MRGFIYMNALALACNAAARSAQHVGKTLPELPPRHIPKYPLQGQSYPQVNKRQTSTNASRFAIDGSAIPDVPFNIGESYAGLLPISSNANETQELYFWYFPSTNPAAGDEITIWLNGGPGCSSLEGLLQENGPFLWQYGTFAPVPNPWTWVNLTNMVWVEQPVGTGFSQGNVTATSETDVAAQFLGFFKNFVDTFGLQNRKVYITGESYAGYYVPYIADAMLNSNDTTYYNVKSIMVYDPSTSTEAVQRQSAYYTFHFELSLNTCSSCRCLRRLLGPAILPKRIFHELPPWGSRLLRLHSLSERLPCLSTCGSTTQSSSVQ